MRGWRATAGPKPGGRIAGGSRQPADRALTSATARPYNRRSDSCPPNCPTTPIMLNPIDSPEYWIENFKPSAGDLDVLYEYVLDAGRPFAITELAEEMVRHHVRQAVARRTVSKSASGLVYAPADRFEVKQKLVFPALDGAEGVVSGVRPGNNPEYGEYEVIQVTLGGVLREFAAGLTWQHPLMAVDPNADPDALARRYGAVVAPGLAALLAADKDWLRRGDSWILRALLPRISPGQLNLAEAVIMLAGEPLPGDQILRELDVDASVPLATRALALDTALSADDRFRNVGAVEAPLWTVTAQLG